MAGFTKLDNDLLGAIITANLTKRQLKILLLIVRYSYGYQKNYALLKKRDFSAAGVSPYCIRDELRKLVQLKVIYADASRDTLWINRNIPEWAVEIPGDNLRRMTRIAVKNSVKAQLADFQNASMGVSKTATPYKDRERYLTNEDLFLALMRRYITQVSPLTDGEAATLRQVVDSFPSQAVAAAIDEVSAGNDRHFTTFLKVLDRLTADHRRSARSRFRSGLRRLWNRLPRP